MSAFEGLRATTLCPFAAASKVWVAGPWRSEAGWDWNVEQQARELNEFARRSAAESYHGFAAEVGMGDDAASFDAVRLTFAHYIRSLARSDASCAARLAGDLEAPGWQFEFAGVPMFLNVFAPCYPRPHSKYIDTPGSFWVFFQPDGAFDLCGINSTRTRTKDGIRKAFADAGMPYDGPQIDRRIEALLYMFPLSPGDPPVRWWA